MITHNHFDTFLILYFIDLNKAKVYKMPYRDSPHHEVEKLMSFNYFNLFKPNEYKEDYHIRKPNDKNFLIEIEAKKYF